jgi:hypothetical protein
MNTHLCKMLNNYKYITLLTLLLSIVQISMAQSACTNTLKKAETMYENGNIEEIPDVLQSCMKRGFTKEEKIRGHKLIIKSHLFNQNMEQAKASMLSFLKDYPEYVPDRSVDGADFMRLVDKFETLPFLSIGAFAGANISSVSVIQPYALNNDDKQSYNYGSPGFQLGVEFSRPLHKYVEINLGLAIERNSFEYTNNSFGFSETKFIEKQTRFSIPLSGALVYKLGKFIPFVGFGLHTSYLISDEVTPSRTYTDNSNDDITGTEIDMLPHRNRINLSLLTNVGLRYKIPEGYLFFRAAYQIGLINQANPSARYDNPELTYMYYYLDDDFALNNLSFSFGYTRMLYKPKPKK